MNEQVAITSNCRECRRLVREGKRLGIHVDGGIACQDHSYLTRREHNAIVDAISKRIRERFKCDALTAGYVISGVLCG